MAYRRHIIAARNTTKEAMAQALANAQISDVEEAGGWCWAMASVWTARGGDLLDAVGNLVGPTLLTTTEDGSRWWLHLVRKGQDRFSTFHDFTLLWRGTAEDEGEGDWRDIYGDEDDPDAGGQVIEIGAPPLPKERLTPLDFEDDFFEAYADEDLEEDDSDDEEGDYSDSPIDDLLADYEDFGAPLPDSIMDALESTPESEAKDRFLELHAAYISEMLQSYGVPHDRDAVLRILTGENVTDGELESDVGNLWRFLAHLGLGSKFEEAQQELEDEEDEDEEVDPVAHILESVKGLEMHPVTGGPASIEAGDGPLLCRISQGLEDVAEFTFLARLDTDDSGWPEDPVPSYVQLVPVDGGTAMVFDAPNVPMAPRARKRIGGLLASLPSGTNLVLAATGDRSRFRVCGEVVNGTWRVESTSFPTHEEELRDLVALFRTADMRGAYSLRDEAEAETVFDAARHDIVLYNSLPQRDGLTVRCASQEDANALACILFRLRYRHRWDVEALEKRLRENFQEWIELTERMNAESELPVTDTVILDGAASRFLEPDYDAPSVDDAQREHATHTAGLDSEFSALGFECLGAMVCERVGGGFLRCYANAGEHAYAVAYFMPYLDPWYDFVSITEDGTFFTTTCSAMESSIRTLRILIRLSSERDLAVLHRDHQMGLAKLRDRGMAPAPIDPSLKGIARTMDGFLMRRLGPEGEDDEF